MALTSTYPVINNELLHVVCVYNCDVTLCCAVLNFSDVTLGSLEYSLIKIFMGSKLLTALRE
jgi:hypothetical protein